MGKLVDAPQAFTFDDFVLAPNHSTVKSRKDPEVSINKETMKLNIPLISSPMSSVTEEEMMVTMANLGGMGVLHRFMSLEQQMKIVQRVAGKLYGIDNSENYICVAIGANGDFKERAIALYDVGVRNFCIDVANGHAEYCVNAVKDIKELCPEAYVMAGNVCTFDGALRLAEAGADSIRVGVGPGSVCTTRQVTGHGVPQLSAIEDCVRIKWRGNGFSDNSPVPSKYHNVTIIADGGIRKSGDIVKSLAIGADVVMIGSLLAGTEESPGDIIEENDRLYKYYAGMASEYSRSKWFDRVKSGFVPEGISTKIPYTGKTAKDVVNGLVGGLQAGMSYADAHTLLELQGKAKWMRVTGPGVIEGSPHGKKF